MLEGEQRRRSPAVAPAPPGLPRTPGLPPGVAKVLFAGSEAGTSASGASAPEVSFYTLNPKFLKIQWRCALGEL